MILCLNCQKNLDKYQKKFCSTSCSTSFRNKQKAVPKIFINCNNCGKETLKVEKDTKFCSRSCSATFSNKKRSSCDFKHEITCKNCNEKYIADKRGNSMYCKKCKNKVTVLRRYKTIDGLRVCKYCDSVCSNEYCKNISLIQFLPSLVKYFTFDKTKIGSIEFNSEVERVKSQLYEDYFINKMSTIEMQKKYNCLNQRVNMILNFFFKEGLRSLSNASTLAILGNKNKFKIIKHTSWNGRVFNLRSKLEEKYAKKLDKKRILYYVEPFRVKYFDPVSNSVKYCVPDFYLPEKNLIVEIKSTWTLSVWDKKEYIIKEYLKQGYKFALIIGEKKVNYRKLI